MVETGSAGTRPWLGLIANTPVNAAGMRTEPAASVPRWMAPRLSAAAAAAPEEEPPGVLDRSHGLRVTPVSGESPVPFQPN